MIREPAVAGTFYSSNTQLLKNQVTSLLEKAGDYEIKPKALIVPHAGYEYSGLTAAHAYKTLKKTSYAKVILLGPSHTTYFNGAATLEDYDWKTPLGIVKAGKLKIKDTIIINSSTPHLNEHCLEVQLPFLQLTLKKFRIIPIIIGNANTKILAETIIKNLDDETLIIASSDLSHYKPLKQAEKVDRQTISNILNFKITENEACGNAAIQTLMYIAKEKNWRAQLLKYDTSATALGDTARVVGYAGIAYY